MSKSYTEDEMKNIDLTVIEMLMVKEAKKMLQDTILQEMDEMLTKVAVESIRNFAEIKTQKGQKAGAMGTEVNYQVQFVQKVVNNITHEAKPLVVYNKK